MYAAVEFTFCLFDQLPIDQSPLYQAMVAKFGKKEADRWTYVEEVPVINHPPPEEEKPCESAEKPSMSA